MAALAPTELEYDDIVDKICADPETPPIVLERLALASVHDSKCEGVKHSIAKESAEIQDERAALAQLRGTIEREESRIGPLKRTRTDKDGKSEVVTLDRVTPLRAKDAALRTRLNEVSNTHVPRFIGGAARHWLAGQRDRTLIEAEPVKVTLKKGETITDAYARQQEDNELRLAKIETIWRASRPVEEVLAEIPAAVDRLAHAPRLGEFFAGSHTSRLRGKRTIERPSKPNILFEQEQVAQDYGVNLGVVTNVTALACWLHRDLLIEKLSDLARARAKDSRALSAEAKREALDKAYEELEVALRIEVALGFEVEAQTGGIVDFRRVHPSVILGLAADPAAIAEYDPR